MSSSFGLAGVYRRFVKGFAKFSRPLSDMSNNEAPVTFTEMYLEAEKSSEQLKQILVNPPTPLLPRRDGELYWYWIQTPPGSRMDVACIKRS